MFQNIHIHIANSSSVSLGKKPRLRGFAKPVFTIMFLPQHRHEDGQIETEDFRGILRSKAFNIYIKTKPHHEYYSNRPPQGNKPQTKPKNLKSY